MKLGTKIFCTTLALISLSLYYPVNQFIGTLRTRYLEGIEDSLVDQAYILAALAQEQMQEKGFDLYTSLPLLSRYLGHKHITETEYYLRLLEEHFGRILEQSNSCHPGIFPKEKGGGMDG